MSITYRAAMVDRGDGLVLTRPEHADLNDEELIQVALPELEIINEGIRALGDDTDEEEINKDEIVIGEWTE